MKEWYKEGRLTPAQALFPSPEKSFEEFYDLKADPDEVHDLATNLDVVILFDDCRAELKLLCSLKDHLIEVRMFKQSHVLAFQWPATCARASGM